MLLIEDGKILIDNEGFIFILRTFFHIQWSLLFPAKIFYFCKKNRFPVKGEKSLKYYFIKLFLKTKQKYANSMLLI